MTLVNTIDSFKCFLLPLDETIANIFLSTFLLFLANYLLFIEISGNKNNLRLKSSQI